MSCYFRHMQDLFTAAGIKITPDNKKEIDQAIHRIVKVAYKNCPSTWKGIKAGTASPEKKADFIENLKKAFPG